MDAVTHQQATGQQRSFQIHPVNKQPINSSPGPSESHPSESTSEQTSRKLDIDDDYEDDDEEEKKRSSFIPSVFNTNNNDMSNPLWTMCKAILRVLSYIPMLIVLGMMSLGWYSFVLVVQAGRMEDGSIFWAVFNDIVFTGLVFMTLWSYLKCVMANNSVKANPAPSDFDAQGAKHCRKCSDVKPTRAHHCSVCGECVLKMDHHCPWVVNCVGFHNQKFFILFLVYAATSCAYFCIAGIGNFLSSITNHGSNHGHFVVVFTTILLFAFAVTLVPFSGFHINLAAINSTTLEYSYNDRDGNPYDLGRAKNLEGVFGRSKWMWPLPIKSGIGSGWEFGDDHDQRVLLSSAADEIQMDTP